MSGYKILNSIGLLLGLVGVTFIFIWGPPQPNLEEGISICLEDNTPIDDSGKTAKDHDNEIKKKRERHKLMSKIGLLLVFLGFLFQFIATWS